MKKILFAALALALLCGCAKPPDHSAMYKNAAEIYITARVCTLTSPAMEFTVAFSRKDGTDRVTVLAPACIAGVEAQIDVAGSKIVYDGAEIYSPDFGAFGASPVDCISLALSLLAEDEGGLYFERRCENAVMSHTLTLNEDMSLRRIEAAIDGCTVLTAEITAFSMY